jgi:AcrR family transcriptional regulator
MTTQDHRSRVAAEKRERMRMRLIESALHVFATKGVEASVIEDVIEAAGVSRGSFYNYFKTNEELLVAVLQVTSNEVFGQVEIVLAERSDPAERLACALRMVLYVTQRYRHLARFISRVGLAAMMQGSLAMVYMPRDLIGGIEAGRFSIANPLVGIDLVVGTTQAAIFTLSTHEGLAPDYPDEVVQHILLGLGMSAAKARRLAALPIEPVVLPPEALLARTAHIPVTPAPSA